MNNFKRFIPNRYQAILVIVFVLGFSYLNLYKDKDLKEIERILLSSDAFYKEVGKVNSVNFVKSSYTQDKKKYRIVLSGETNQLEVYLVIDTKGSILCYNSGSQRVCKNDIVNLRKKGNGLWM